MRIPGENEDLVGKVCICSIGRIGIVSGRALASDGLPARWVGLGFDGKGTWASTSPVVAWESLSDYHDVLLERFGGKLSFNS